MSYRTPAARIAGFFGLIALVVLPLVAAASPQTPDGVDGADAIVGVWETAPSDKGYAHIEMSRQGDVYVGTIVWINEPRYPPGDEMAGEIKIDRMNPEPGLREREIVGLQIVDHLAYAGDGRWEGGSIYDPESGKTYKSRAAIADGGETLKLRGYIGFSLLGRTSEWKRIHPE